MRVDATHLKTVYSGVLIVATAHDPDHHHYPIAFGLVDGEKDESWMWFMNKFKTVVQDDEGMAFVSDRNVTLIKSICSVFPLSQHGFCVFHMSMNVKGHVDSVRKNICAKRFIECAHAYSEREFLTFYADSRKRFPIAATYLDRSVEVNKWAWCYFLSNKYNIDTSNCAESINSVLRKARVHPKIYKIRVAFLRHTNLKKGEFK